MSRYTGPKGRVNRRLGIPIFESGGATRALERRPNPPGMHQRPRKLSTYGEAMREKQKIKYYYGLGERQLRRLFKEAQKSTGNTGEQLLLLCERRLDSIVRHAGFTSTRPQARQSVAHGHFLLNGHKTDIPGALVRAGDVIYLKRRPNLVQVYSQRMAEFNAIVPDWIEVDTQRLSARVIRLPDKTNITLPVDVGMVVELLSR